MFMVKPALKTLLNVSLVLGAAFLLGQSEIHAQTPGTVRGQVENGTSGAKVPSNMEISLHVVNENQITELQRTHTSSGGTFQFHDVPPNKKHTYLLSTKYHGMIYTSEIDDITQNGPWTLKIYETTENTKGIRVKDNTILIHGKNLEPGRLMILELATIENAGDRTFSPSGQSQGPMGLVRFSLPQGFYNLQVSSQLPTSGFIQVDKGFALLSPIPPGFHNIGFTYSLDYSGPEFLFRRIFPFGAASVRILYPDGLGQLLSVTLQETEPKSVEGITYRVLEGQGFTPGDSVTIDIRGLPQPSLLKRALQSSKMNTIGIIIPPMVLGFALLAMTAHAILTKPLGPHSSLASLNVPEDLGHSGQSSLKAIAKLDDQYQRGDIDKNLYDRERAKLKAKILQRTIATEIDSEEI